jgi:hypothetical protein
MSATSVTPTNRDWFRRLLSGRPHQVIGGPDDPYMLRWYLIPRNPLLNVYLHKFLRSDDDRALHDHPWWFVSLILRGGYLEISETAKGTTTAITRIAPDWTHPWVHRGLGWSALVYRRATYRHRVQLIRGEMSARGSRPTAHEVPAWTLIITGRRVRTWGFWCKRWDTSAPLTGFVTSPPDPVDRFIPWDEFGDAGCGETA